MMDILPCDRDQVHLLRWQSKGRRSKRPAEPHDFDEISAAAEALIMLANSDGGFCTTSTAPKAANNIDSPTTDSTIFHPKKKLKKLSCSSADTDPATATANVVWFKKDEPNSPDTPLLLGLGSDHKCLECGKIFKSHQSLGGHMTRHRRKIQTTTTAAAVRGGVHECSYCHEKFSTGQALGGHMRKHFVKKVVVVAESQSISRDESTRVGVARVKDFDLNMVAVEELDGEW